jgi:hypothetical protein
MNNPLRLGEKRRQTTRGKDARPPAGLSAQLQARPFAPSRDPPRRNHRPTTRYVQGSGRDSNNYRNKYPT